MKVKLAAAVVAAVAVAGGVGGTVAGKMLAGEPAGPKPVETAVPEKDPERKAAGPASGEAVNGFRLSLAGPTDESGSKFSLTWKNVGEKLLELQPVPGGGSARPHDDLCGHVFLKGPDGNMVPDVPERRQPIASGPFRPRTVLVEPGKSHEESFVLWDYVQKPEKAGKYRLWVELEVNSAYAPQSKDATYWNGKIRSNEIEVDVKTGAQAVNGLKFTISADKLEAKAGDEINIDLNFENVSKEAVHILKFDYLTLDWELAAPDGESLQPAPTAMPGLLPPAAKDYPELKAGGQLAWRGRTIFGNPSQVYVGPAANYRNVYLVKPGTYKLTAVYALREGQGQGVAAGKVWAGTVRSNTLALKLGGEFKAPANPGKWPPKGIPGVTPPQKGQQAGEPAKPAAGASDEATARKLAEEWGKAHPAESADWGEFAGIQDQGGRWSVSFQDKLGRGPLVGNPTVFVDKKTGEVTLFKGRH